MNKLVQNGRHKDAREFFDVDEQLSNAENFLKEFGNNIFQETLQNHQNTNYTTITSSEKSDFDFYKPNEAEPYNLDADFSKKKPVSFLFEGKKYDVRNWNRLLVMVCEILNRKDPMLFQSLPEDESLKGRSRKYFIREASKYHQKVGGTGIWVLTNNDGSSNCRTIMKMFEKYNIPITSMEIFLRTDDLSTQDENEENNISENVKKN